MTILSFKECGLDVHIISVGTVTYSALQASTLAQHRTLGGGARRIQDAHPSRNEKSSRRYAVILVS